MKQLLLAFSLGVMLSNSSAAPAEAQQKKAAPRKEDTFLNGSPFTLDQISGFVRDKVIPFRRLQEAIANRGIDFYFEPEVIEKLKAHGATEEMLELLGSKAPKKPEPELPKFGRLSIKCEPAECVVSLNGKLLNTTQNGTLEIPELEPGTAVVDFKKEGYVVAQRTVAIEAGKAAVAAVKLDIDRVARESYGADLFKRMLTALGGDAGIKGAASMETLGSMTLALGPGQLARWTTLARVKPGAVLFQVRAGGDLFYEVAFAGSRYTASKGLKGDDAVELPAKLAMVRDNLPFPVLSKLTSGKYRITADHKEPAPGEQFTLRAESSTDTISIGLNANFRPERVKIETATGLGSVLIVYADYIQKDKTWFPRDFQVKSLAAQEGVVVRFDEVTLNPQLKDNDYTLRGKALPRIR